MTKKSTLKLRLTSKDKIDSASRNRNCLNAGMGVIRMGTLTCCIHSIVLCALLIAGAPGVNAQDANFVWAKNMGGTGDDIGQVVAVDGNGNVYVTGRFDAAGADFNPGGSGGVLASAGGNDVFVAKYDPSGAFLWAKSMGGTGSDAGRAVAVDGNGNVYVTGYFAAQGANFNPGGSGGALTSAGGDDVFVAKYDPNGAFLWAKSMGGTGFEGSNGVAVDGNGNVYVTGNFAAAGANFNPGGSGGTLTSAGGNDVFVAKYDANGTYQWAKSMGGTGSDIGNEIAVDGNGNVYVTGNLAAAGANFNPGGSGGALTSAGGIDVFVAKYDPNGTFLWAKSMGGTGFDVGNGVAADGNGNVYVTGYFDAAGANFNPGGSGGALTTAGSSDVFVAKYDPSGAFLWAKSMGGTGFDVGYRVAADGNGNVYVTGQLPIQGADFNPGGSGGALTSAGSNDVFVTRCDPNGTFLWAKSMGGTGFDIGYGVAVDGNGNVYVTGQFGAAGADFNPGGSGGTLTSAGSDDGFVVRLSQECEEFITFTESACNSFVFNGVTYTTSGTYIDTFTSSAYCDSIVTLNLTILDTVWYAVPVTACDTYLFNEQTYTNSGSYTQAFTSALGCDSIVTLDLIINLSSDSLVSGHYCDSVTFNGQTYTSSGTYVQHYTTAGGCDSNITYDITIGWQSNSDSLTQTACDRFVFNDTTVYTTTGIHIVTLTNESGCDSTIVLNLTINRSPEASVVRTGSILTVNSAERYQWINCDNNTAIPGATEQSYTATQNGNYAVIITLNDCTDTSDCVLVDNITGINELDAGNKMRLYPNPANGRIMIETQEALKDATIRLVSVVGQSLLEQAGVSGTVFSVDVTQYAAGVYFVEISEEGKTVRMKVVKD